MTIIAPGHSVPGAAAAAGGQGLAEKWADWLGNTRKRIDELRGQGKIHEANAAYEEAKKAFPAFDKVYSAEARQPVPDQTGRILSNYTDAADARLDAIRKEIPVNRAIANDVIDNRGRVLGQHIDATGRIANINTQSRNQAINADTEAFRTRTGITTNEIAKRRTNEVNSVLPILDRTIDLDRYGMDTVRYGMDKQGELVNKYIDAAIATNKDTPLDYITGIGGTLGQLAAGLSLFMG